MFHIVFRRSFETSTTTVLRFLSEAVFFKGIIHEKPTCVQLTSCLRAVLASVEPALRIIVRTMETRSRSTREIACGRVQDRERLAQPTIIVPMHY